MGCSEPAVCVQNSLQHYGAQDGGSPISYLEPLPASLADHTPYSDKNEVRLGVYEHLSIMNNGLPPPACKLSK